MLRGFKVQNRLNVKADSLLSAINQAAKLIYRKRVVTKFITISRFKKLRK